MADVNLTVSAELGDLRRQLEQIPGITAEQARLMVAELDRGLKRAEKAAQSAAKATKASMKQAEEATRKAAEAGKDLGDSFGRMGGDAGKLAGALDMLMPGLGSVGQGVADLADVGEVAAGALGGAAAPALAALAVVAAGAFIQISHVTAEMEREAEAARIAGLANDFVRQQLELQRIAALDLAVATDQMSEAARDEAQIRAQAAKSLEGYLAGLAETSAKALETENRNMALVKGFQMLATAATAPLSALIAVANVMGATIPTAADLTKKVAEYMGVIGNYPKVQEDVAKATAKATDEVKRTRDAQIRAAGAKREHVAATKELLPVLKEEKVITDALNDASRTVEAARQAELSEVQKLTEQYVALSAEEQARASAGTLSAEDAAKYATARTDIERMITDARIEEELRAISAIEAYEEEARKRRQAAAAEELAQKIDAARKFADVTNEVAVTAAAISSEVLDRQTQDLEDAMAAREALGENATRAEKKAADERIMRERKQAQIAFAIDQALKVAQAVTAAALATINALATPPAPNYIAAGLAAAQGAVQVAAIAATRPSFHSGGMADFAPDEASAIVRRGEAVLSPAGRAAIGDDAIRAANAGMGTGGTIVVQQVYRHRVFDSFVQDNLRTRGPLSRALGSGARLGQRS
jgi:hypothetical protein